jgi:transcriptional regulator with XRE-family HTH domain
MSEIKKIIGENLTDLRKRKRLTQAELATKLNYSDKAISKWEHGDAIPSIENLIEICKFYGISLDQLVSENRKDIKPKDEAKQNKINKIIITLLSFFTIWTIATIFYVFFNIALGQNEWLFFVYAVPVSIIVLIVFNGIWGKAKYTYFLVTILIWTIISAIYLTILIKVKLNMWQLFLIGIPATVITILSSRIKR